MNQKNRLLDPSLWLLIGINGYLIYYYYQNPGIFTTLIWIYWCQSVMLGLFNALDMLTSPKQKTPVTINDKPLDDNFPVQRAGALFFLFHYGFFHVGYMIFIFTMKRTGPFDIELFKGCLIAFLIGQIITFIQHKINQKKNPISIGKMFFTPYIRIIPMHLTILIPNFLPVSNMGVFVILKTFSDVVMYLVTTPSGKSRETDEVLLTTQQGLN